ncbi:MAG: hypothetical protein KAS32_12125 [Candidatus Peribacteraceae bacterium]|nr:hypothetical protein [Candidatus Peribacteraceae bacterium]
MPRKKKDEHWHPHEFEWKCGVLWLNGKAEGQLSAMRNPDHAPCLFKFVRFVDNEEITVGPFGVESDARIGVQLLYTFDHQPNFGEAPKSYNDAEIETYYSRFRL